MLSRTALSIHQRALSRSNSVSKIIMYRTMHIACRIQSTGVKFRSVVKLSKHSPILGTCQKRYSSTTDAANALAAPLTSVLVDDASASKVSDTIASTAESAMSSTSEVSGTAIAEGLTSKILETIPDVPLPPAPTVAEIVTYAGEPPFSALGLGTWSPVGMVQQGMEWLHIGCGLPWWEAIAIGTLIVRCAVFPLVILAQRNGAKMSNHMPEIIRMQQEISEARQYGDQLRIAKKSQELMMFMKTSGCSPLKNMLVPMAQGPIFISVFLGLRRMAELPVESMKTGGLWWFTDLTVADPYYLLPLITAATLAVTIEIGTDSARAEAMGMIRYVMRALPVVIFPFTLNFPAAILCYWASSNFISLVQCGFLRIPKVRTFFKIDPLKKHPSSVKGAQKGFVEGIKSSWANMKSMREMNARYEVDQVQFHRAGRGPIQKTYTYDPTKQITTKASAVMAKKG